MSTRLTAAIKLSTSENLAGLNRTEQYLSAF